MQQTTRVAEPETITGLTAMTDRERGVRVLDNGRLTPLAGP